MPLAYTGAPLNLLEIATKIIEMTNNNHNLCTLCWLGLKGTSLMPCLFREQFYVMHHHHFTFNIVFF